MIQLQQQANWDQETETQNAYCPMHKKDSSVIMEQQGKVMMY